MGGSQSAAEYRTVYSQDGYGREEDDKPLLAPSPFFRQPTMGDKVDALLGFDVVSADAMVTSCFVTPAALLFVRVFMLLYAAAILTWHSLAASSGSAWLQSMVSWTLLLTVSYLLLAVVLTSIKVGGGYRGSMLSSSVWLRMGFVMYEFCFTWSLATVLLFWCTADRPADTTALVQSLHLHGATLAFATIDLLISRLKFEFSHYLLCAATAVLYLIANAVWFGVTISPLHGFKWNSFFSVLLLFGVMFGVVVSFVIGAMLTTMRDLCYAHHNNSLAVVLPSSSRDPEADAARLKDSSVAV